MTKDVQLLYSACGRETNGVQKLNFSKTETCKYLRGTIILLELLILPIQIIDFFSITIFFLFSEVITDKCPDLLPKEITEKQRTGKVGKEFVHRKTYKIRMIRVIKSEG